MKAGKLKTAIRSMSGAPEVVIHIEGKPYWVKVQKTSLVDVLSEAFPSKADELSAEVDGTKVIFGDEHDDDIDTSSEPVDELAEDDEDDLLDGIL